MPRRKEAEKLIALGEKDCWHLYGLQVLTPNQFVKVVGKVLKGNYSLVNPGITTKPSVRGF
jgi:hypothetical protein